MRIINHPIVAIVMTLIVAQQWFSLGMLIPGGWSGMLVFHMVLAPIATTAVITYHHSNRRAAYYDGRIDGTIAAVGEPRA